MYARGQQYALAQLGLTKVGDWRERTLKALTGSHSEMISRVPVGAAIGALGGGAHGALADHPGQGALIGALGGSLGGIAVASAPKLRKALIRALTKGKM